MQTRHWDPRRQSKPPQATRLGRARTRPLPTKPAQNLEIQITSNSVLTSCLVNMGAEKAEEGKMLVGFRASQTPLKSCPCPSLGEPVHSRVSAPGPYHRGYAVDGTTALAPGQCAVTSVPQVPLRLTRLAFWGQRQLCSAQGFLARERCLGGIQDGHQTFPENRKRVEFPDPDPEKFMQKAASPRTQPALIALHPWVPDWG